MRCQSTTSAVATGALSMIPALFYQHVHPAHGLGRPVNSIASRGRIAYVAHHRERPTPTRLDPGSEFLETVLRRAMRATVPPFVGEGDGGRCPDLREIGQPRLGEAVGIHVSTAKPATNRYVATQRSRDGRIVSLVGFNDA
jgi:hypothetical protein